MQVIFEYYWLSVSRDTYFTTNTMRREYSIIGRRRKKKKAIDECREENKRIEIDEYMKNSEWLSFSEESDLFLLSSFQLIEILNKRQRQPQISSYFLFLLAIFIFTAAASVYWVSYTMRDQLAEWTEREKETEKRSPSKLNASRVRYFFSLSLDTSEFRLIGKGISLASSCVFSSTFTWRGASIRRVWLSVVKNDFILSRSTFSGNW